MKKPGRSKREEIIKKVEEYVQGYMADDLHHDYWHAKRVARYAVQIAREEGADEYIVELAALLHDIGKRFEKEEGRSHTIIGSEIVRRVLGEFGVDDETIDRVLECVKSHSRISSRRKPESLEAEVIYDADGLDMVGAVGLLRAALSAVMKGGGWEHVVRKIKWRLELLNDFKTEAGKRISAERARLVISFADQLFRELRQGSLAVDHQDLLHVNSLT